MKNNIEIPFNKPYCSIMGIEYIIDSISCGKISGDGKYTQLCNKWFRKKIDRKVLITHSCTASLEMMALLANIKPGDEVILPSFTFVSTANAIILRGATPVFIDIKPTTCNMDENLIEQAISSKTRGIFVVHYAGVGCDMDEIIKIARKYNLYVMEDAAQGFGAFYKGKPLGTIGDLGSLSFHETKNIISGEGGCLILNNPNFVERAEIIREKGTNRSKFFRGEIDKYTWVDIGSSYLPSDMICAYLYSQLEESDKILKHRIKLWNQYNDFFEIYERKGYIKRPYIPEYCKHNAHIYYIFFENLNKRSLFIDYLKKNDIHSVFHYVPLHSSPAGKKYGKIASKMNITNKVSETLVRLPLFYQLDDEMEKIFDVIEKFFKEIF